MHISMYTYMYTSAYTCICIDTEEKYLSDGRPRGKRKKGPKLTSCPFLKPATLQNFKDLALVSS